MALGLERPARLLYLAYALYCHQLPQRSYFLFGPRGIETYSLEQVLAWGGDPAYLRGFLGNAQVGGFFAPVFYDGTGIGSLNWLLRTFSGALFGLSTVWLLYPPLNKGFCRQTAVVEDSRP